MKVEYYLQRFDEVEARTQYFVSKVKSCVASGRELLNEGAALVAAYKDIQMARQQQELEFQKLMADLDERSRRFDVMLPYVQNSLNQRMKAIEDIRKEVFDKLQNGVNNEDERYACNTVLRMLELEHQHYFSELDRLLYL